MSPDIPVMEGFICRLNDIPQKPKVLLPVLSSDSQLRHMGRGLMLQGDSISISHHRHMPLSEIMSWRPEPT